MRLFICLLFSAFFLQRELPAQGFLFNQLFRPSLRMNMDGYVDLGQNQGQYKSDINLILPIKSKLGLGINWSKLLFEPNAKGLLKSTKIKAYQIFWNFRPKLFYYHNSETLGIPSHLSTGVSTGVTGVHLLSKRRFLLYTLNLGLQESRGTWNQTQLNVNSIFAIAKIKKLSLFWYYGVFVNYSAGQFLPIPFIGIRKQFNAQQALHLLFPLQLSWEYNWHKRGNLTLSAGWTILSSTYKNPYVRTDLNRAVYNDLSLGLVLQQSWKVSKQSRLFLRLGAHYWRGVEFFPQQGQFIGGRRGVSPYAGFSFFYAFKKSLLAETMDGIIAL